MTVESLARILSDSLARDNARKVLSITAGAPEWVTDVCRKAHGDMMPDDWRFEFVQDAADAIADGAAEDIDLDSVYPYTHDRLAWLASRNDRYSYCDEAAEDMGDRSGGSVLTLIAWGMDRELREVMGIVRGELESLATDGDEE